jgi:hypothetical protein
MYSPTIGRFISQDSWPGKLDEPASLNLYLYGYANPLRYVDPTGHQTVGAQYCRGYACDDSARRHFDPLYDAAKSFEEFRDSVGMGISIGAANTLLAMNSPGHMTPEAEAEYYVQPTNRTEKVVSVVTEIALLVGIPVALKELAPARSEPAPTGLRVEGRAAGPKPALEPVPTTTKPSTSLPPRQPAPGDPDFIGPTLPEWKGPADYSQIKAPSEVVKVTKPTPRQVAEMKAANRAQNQGLLRDDQTGELMVDSAKSKKGVKPPPNEAQVDHKKAVSRGGTRAQENLELRTRKANREKSDKDAAGGQ